MEKYYNFEGEFNQDNLDKFLSFFHSYTKDKLIIFLNSIGGDASIERALLMVLNNNKDRIELIGNHFIGSSAFKLFFSFQGPKRLLKTTVGMWHKTRIEIDVFANFKPVDKVYNFIMEHEDEADAVFNAKLDLSEDELRKFKDGEDLYFGYNRMLSILNNN